MLPPTRVYCDGGMLPNPYYILNGRRMSSRSDIGCTWGYCWTDGFNQRIHEDWGAYLLPNQPMIMAGHFRYVKAEWGLNDLTSPLAELLAAINCIHRLPPQWSGEFCCDSEVTIGRLFGIDGNFFEWKNVPDEMRRKAEWAVSRLGNVTPVLLDGHPTVRHLLEGKGKRGHPVSLFNAYVDELCNNACKIYMKIWHEEYAKNNPQPNNLPAA